MLETPPILLLAFNRPDVTAQLFSALKAVAPKRLFIVADGPREGKGDEEKCRQVRAILSGVDWECEVKRLYRAKNVGLEKGLGEALTWFFDQVEMGIVLEDDCIPDPTFFGFCAQMLDRYKDDDQVMVVNGSSFLSFNTQDPQAYYLSKYVHFWGWASWKRAWKLYDPQMAGWPQFRENSSYASLFGSIWERRYFSMVLDSTYLGKTNSWGYRWLYSVWKNGGKSVCPGVNLIRNIGFTKDATHKVIRKFELPSRSIALSPKQASLSFSRKADKETARRYYAISPFMVTAMRLYYLWKK